MPRIPIIMPQLGESIAEATIVHLPCKVGDEVEAGASAFDGIIAARLVSASPARLRKATIDVHFLMLAVAVGAASVLSPAYISEVTPAHIRGRLSSAQQVMIISGLTGAFLALTVVAVDIGHLGTSATELQTIADIAGQLRKGRQQWRKTNIWPPRRRAN